MPIKKPINRNKKPIGKTYKKKLPLQDVPGAVKSSDPGINKKISDAYRIYRKKRTV